jgi:hypothetical protein
MAETKQAKAKKTPSRKASGGSGSKSKAKAVKAPSSANGAQSTANGVAPIVQKAKIPLLAGGAAVAGVAGAVLASRSGGKRKVLGVAVPKRSKLSLPKKNGFKSDARKVTSAVADAAKRADHFGQGVSRIASSVKQVSDSADEAVKKG